MGKPAFNDLREGIITAPIIYSLLEFNKTQSDNFGALNKIINEEKTEDSIKKGVKILLGSNGISNADKLSIQHIEKAIESLESMKYTDGRPIISFEQEHAQALVGLALKVKTRKY